MRVRDFNAVSLRSDLIEFSHLTNPSCSLHISCDSFNHSSIQFVRYLLCSKSSKDQSNIFLVVQKVGLCEEIFIFLATIPFWLLQSIKNVDHYFLTKLICSDYVKTLALKKPIEIS